MKGKQSYQHNSEVTYFKIKIMKPFITVGRIYYVFLGIDDGLESYMQFVIM